LKDMRLRAWDKNEQKMIYKFMIGSITDMEDTDWTCPSSLNSQGEWFNNDMLDIMLYSDIKDSNDELICEGDIIEFSYGIPPRRVRGEVVFRGGAFEVLTPGHNPEFVLLRDLKYYVGEMYIEGNMFENKDILC